MNKLWAIKSYSFYAGIIENDGTIVVTAPILKKHVGWSMDNFRLYAQRSRWAIIDPEIHEQPMELPSLLEK